MLTKLLATNSMARVFSSLWTKSATFSPLRPSLANCGIRSRGKDRSAVSEPEKNPEATMHRMIPATAAI